MIIIYKIVFNNINFQKQGVKKDKEDVDEDMKDIVDIEIYEQETEII